MNTPQKIQFYRLVLNSMEKDLYKWNMGYFIDEIKVFQSVLSDVENDYENGAITDPHPRQLKSGRIAKRWEWWLSRSIIGKLGLFKIEE